VERVRRTKLWRTGVVSLVVILGCATAQEIVALRQVQFHLNGVTDPRVAGIPIESVHSYADLRPADLARLGVSIAAGDVPLQLTLQVEGRNPETNTVTAKLVALDWSYLVDDRELVTGSLSEPYSFPPGKARDVPVLVRLNLVQAFGTRRRDLIDAALALAGKNASSHRVTLRLAPTVDTPLGPIRYPVPITLEISAPEAR